MFGGERQPRTMCLGRQLILEPVSGKGEGKIVLWDYVPGRTILGRG